MNADQKLIETVILIAICHHCGNKWRSETMFLKIFYLRSSIVLALLIAAYPVCQRSTDFHFFFHALVGHKET